MPQVKPPSRPMPGHEEAQESPETHQLKLCRAQNAYLHRELSKALGQVPMAQVDASTEEQWVLEVDHLRQRVALLMLHNAQAQQDIDQLKRSLAFAHKVLGWKTPEAELFASETRHSEGFLLALLALAHPDKWCQGQLATELAHELTIAINRQREALADR